MFKRGMILFSVILFIFSLYSYDVSSVNQQCGGCEEDADCNVDNNGNEFPRYQWNYACRTDRACLEGNNFDNIQYECTGGQDAAGYTKSECAPLNGNGNRCVQVQGYGDRDYQGRCENVYSCDGAQLNINYKTFNNARVDGDAQ